MDAEKKLDEIFGHVKMKAEQSRIAGEQFRELRAASFKRSVEHLHATVEPELRRLAALIEKQGPKATVETSAPTGQGPDRASVTLTIFPEGHKAATADEVPHMQFVAGHDAISVHEHAMSPSRFGHTGAAGSFPGTRITAQDVEQLVLKLVENCFGDRRREPRADQRTH